MSLTILDLEDAELEGRAAFREADQEIELEMYEDLIEMGIAMAYAMIPEDVLLMIKQSRPDLAEQMEKMYGDMQYQPEEKKAGE